MIGAMYDVCVIGHVTRDVTVIGGRRGAARPGGTAYYAGVALGRLGATTQVVTKLAPEDAGALLGELEASGVAVVSLPSAGTTAFDNVYPDERMDERIQTVRAVAEPFTEADLGAAQSRILLLGPLTGSDMSADVIAAAKSRGGLVALDAQGLLRRAAGTRVEPADWPDKAAGLAAVDILETDADEARLLCGEGDPARAARALARLGPREVLITLGSRGSLAWAKGQLHEVPAYPPARLVDATGCGDSYLAGYLFARLGGADVPESARFAAAVASAKLTRAGPFAGTEREVRALVAAHTPES